MNHTPRSVEGFRALYGRAPTVLEMRAILSGPPKRTPVQSNGCDCMDLECYVCNPDQTDHCGSL